MVPGSFSKEFNGSRPNRKVSLYRNRLCRPFYLFMWLLPYIALGMALYAFGYMLMQNNRGNNKNRRNRR